jgi:ribonuclease HI
MEPVACVKGVRAAMALGISDIVLESDAKQVITAIEGDEFKLSPVGGIVPELKELLAENFSHFQVKYAPRDCNRVAHELAVIGYKCHEAQPSVLTGVPYCIMYLVSSDLTDIVE